MLAAECKPASGSFLCCFHRKSATVKHNNRLNTTLLQHLHFLHAIHHMPACAIPFNGAVIMVTKEERQLKGAYLSVNLPSQISSAQQ